MLKNLLSTAPALSYPDFTAEFILDSDASNHGNEEPEAQLARWIEFLSPFEYEIEYREGQRHANADTISRRPCIAKAVSGVKSVRKVNN